MSDVLVSVICLAYNHEKYIEKMLEGVVKQKTSFRYEVLINDDASTDNTAAIIQKYAAMYPDIIKPIYQGENQYSKGINIIKDILLPCANGIYIAFCEGDDYWNDEEKLELQYTTLKNHPECSMVVHRVQCCNEDGSENEMEYPSRDSIFQSNQIIPIESLLDLFFVNVKYAFHTSSYFVRKNVLSGENHKFKRDVGISYSAITAGAFYYIDRKMSVRRLWSVNNFNTRLKAQGGKGKVKVWKDDINNVKLFEKNTLGKYHDYTAYRLLSLVLMMAKYAPEDAISLAKENNISFGDSTKVVPVKKRISLFIKYILFKCSSVLYVKREKERKKQDG